MLRSNRQRRKLRIRARVFGTASRPRASVFRGLRAIRVQLIDDTHGRTLVAAQAVRPQRARSEAARRVGRTAGERALALGVRELVFDRSGYRYHGQVKAVAEGLREAGLKL